MKTGPSKPQHGARETERGEGLRINPLRRMDMSTMTAAAPAMDDVSTIGGIIRAFPVTESIGDVLASLPSPYHHRHRYQA